MPAVANSAELPTATTVTKRKRAAPARGTEKKDSSTYHRRCLRAWPGAAAFSVHAVRCALCNDVIQFSKGAKHGPYSWHSALRHWKDQHDLPNIEEWIVKCDLEGYDRPFPYLESCSQAGERLADESGAKKKRGTAKDCRRYADSRAPYGQEGDIWFGIRKPDLYAEGDQPKASDRQALRLGPGAEMELGGARLLSTTVVAPEISQDRLDEHDADADSNDADFDEDPDTLPPRFKFGMRKARCSPEA